VTPSFNQGRYIEQTIFSVLNQNYPNLEYIIIDGGSTDNTVDIIKKYESNLKYWVSEPDSGQTDAINKGFSKCTGEIFNWINSDDYYTDGAFFEIANIFSNNLNCDVVCGKEWGFNDLNPNEKVLHPGSVIAANVYDTIRIGIIDQPCSFFRKSSVDSIFPLDVSLRYVMDRQMWWGYLLKYGQSKIIKTDMVFTYFRLHPQSKSVNEGMLFDSEFNRLKLSLLKQLNCSGVLVNEFDINTSLIKNKFEIYIKKPNYIFASFASFYAERAYVEDNLTKVSSLMKIVKNSKGLYMNRNYLYLVL
jgi:glycosyltransferase involved in cell wall biosynthesis